jgi:hypothetical protein
MMDANNFGLDYAEKDEKEKVIKDEMLPWHKHPGMIQSLIIFVCALIYLVTNHNSISLGVSSFVVDLTGLKVVTLFTISFTVALLLFAWFILSTYYTGGISNKIFYAKLFKKKLQLHRGDDNIFHFYIPKLKPTTWEVEGVGVFRKKKAAMGWLENGVLMAPSVDGYDEFVDFDEIKNKQLIITDGKVQEDRIRAAKLEAKEEEKKPLSTNAMLGFGTVILLISVGAWLMMDKSQSATCQNQLAEITNSLAKNAELTGVKITTTTTTLKSPLMSVMQPKQKDG